MKRNMIIPILITLVLASCARGAGTSGIPSESSSSVAETTSTGRQETETSEALVESSGVYETQSGGVSEPTSTAAASAKPTQPDIGRTTITRKTNQPINTTTSSKVKTTVPTTTATKKANVRECVYNAELSTQIFNMVNDYRQQNGVAKLAYNATNAEYARRQAEYNAVNDVPRKSVHAIYQIGAAGTGVAITGGVNSISSRAMDGWVNSPGHKANILDAEMNYGGAAVYEIRFNSVCEEYVVIYDFDSIAFPKPDPGIQK